METQKFVNFFSGLNAIVGSSVFGFVFMGLTYNVPYTSPYALPITVGLFVFAGLVGAYRAKQTHDNNFRQPYFAEVLSYEERLQNSPNVLDSFDVETMEIYIIKNTSPTHSIRISPLFEDAVQASNRVLLNKLNVSAEMMKNFGIKNFRIVDFAIQTYRLRKVTENNEIWYVRPYRYVFAEPIRSGDVVGCGATYRSKNVYKSRDHFTHTPIIGTAKLVIRFIAPLGYRFHSATFNVQDEAQTEITKEVDRLNKNKPKLNENSTQILWEIRNPIHSINYTLGFELQRINL